MYPKPISQNIILISPSFSGSLMNFSLLSEGLGVLPKDSHDLTSRSPKNQGFELLISHVFFNVFFFFHFLLFSCFLKSDETTPLNEGS